ncbi:ABC transporter [Bacillaceae bacterium SAS-127]|nr:ABC transporter [Bacillaceae bacterium SAS-127]
MEPLLTVSKLNYSLPRFDLTIDQLQLRRGEYLVIVGKTGSGKTVLLECLAGLKQPNNGRIVLEGSDISSSPPETRNIGFAYQDSLLFPFLTVRDNILFAAKAKRIDQRSDIQERFQSIVKRMGIAHLLDRLPRHLSGGERQRVSLARAILLRPQVLLLDEPLSALDANTRGEMCQLLLDLHQHEDMTIIHVTHDISEALQLGSQMAVLQQGHIIEMNEPFELYMKPKRIETAKFLGIENLIPAIIERRNNQLEIQHAGGSFTLENTDLPFTKDMIIGIRHMMLRIHPRGKGEHSFKVTIEKTSFNGQMVLVTAHNVHRWHINVPLSEWQETKHQVGDQIMLYVHKKDILFFNKEGEIT